MYVTNGVPEGLFWCVCVCTFPKSRSTILVSCLSLVAFSLVIGVQHVRDCVYMCVFATA